MILNKLLARSLALCILCLPFNASGEPDPKIPFQAILCNNTDTPAYLWLDAVSVNPFSGEEHSENVFDTHGQLVTPNSCTETRTLIDYSYNQYIYQLRAKLWDNPGDGNVFDALIKNNIIKKDQLIKFNLDKNTPRANYGSVIVSN